MEDNDKELFSLEFSVCQLSLRPQSSALSPFNNGAERQTSASCPSARSNEMSLVKLLFLMGEDGTVGRGISHTGQNITCFNLVIVQEGLVRLVNRA